jgi:hypothetical protein
MKSKLMIALAPLFIAGCQSWGPTWSELTGARYYNLTTFDRQAGVIVGIDNDGAQIRHPIRVEPGTHRVVMQSPRHGGFGRGDVKELTLNVEPCKRYYLNTQFRNATGPAWEPVVDYVEPIAGCRVG